MIVLCVYEQKIRDETRVMQTALVVISVVFAVHRFIRVRSLCMVSLATETASNKASTFSRARFHFALDKQKNLLDFFSRSCLPLRNAL